MNDYRYEPAGPEQIKSDGTIVQFVIRRRQGARPSLFLATKNRDGGIINLRSQFGRAYALATVDNTGAVIYVMNQYNLDAQTVAKLLDIPVSYFRQKVSGYRAFSDDEVSKLIKSQNILFSQHNN